MILVLDAEWFSPEGMDIVHDVQYLHCVVAKELGKDSWFEFKFEEETDCMDFANLMDSTKVLIGHNIVNADLHVFRKLLGTSWTVSPEMTLMGNPCKFVDTYSLSVRLFPDRPASYSHGKSLGVHGLKAWAKRTGMYKPEIEDWQNLSKEEYLNRCREDVLNNEATYYKLLEEMQK